MASFTFLIVCSIGKRNHVVQGIVGIGWSYISHLFIYAQTVERKFSLDSVPPSKKTNKKNTQEWRPVDRHIKINNNIWHLVFFKALSNNLVLDFCLFQKKTKKQHAHKTTKVVLVIRNDSNRRQLFLPNRIWRFKTQGKKSEREDVSTRRS